MELPGIYKREIIEKEIRNKQTNRNGGYPMYFKLYKEFNQKMKSDFVLINFKPLMRFKIRCQITLQFLFKPLLSLFHTVTNYESKFKLVDGSLDKIESFSKETTIYFLKVIPILYMVSNKPTDKDLEILK